MTENTRLENSLSEAVYDRLFATSQSQRWLVKRQSKLNLLIDSCEGESEKNLVCDILDRFTYIDGETLSASLEEIAKRISVVWECAPNNTVVVAMDKSRHADSSSAIAWLIKPALAELGDWETTNFFKNLSDAVHSAKAGGNIVIVDEFIGSGQTLAKSLKWISSELSKAGKCANIYVASIAAMEICKKKDLSLAKDFYSTRWLKQALNDYHAGAELSAALNVMLGMEGKLHPIHNFVELKKYSLGYKKSQSAYYLESGNPPNNNFPIFWWKLWKNGERRIPLIPRI